MRNNAPAPSYSTLQQPEGFRGSWSAFWFWPIAPTGLHALRVCCGILFILWLLPFAGHQTELFSLLGWCDTQTHLEMSRMPGGAPVPRGWSLLYLAGENTIYVHALYWAALGSFLLFTLGMATRITSVLTWLFVVSFAANPATLFHADFLLIILAFYMMIGYLLLGQWSGATDMRNRLVCNRGTFLSPYSDDCSTPSYAANLAIRLIQVHFAIIFVSSGLIKLQSGEWWRGAALWFPLHDAFAINADQLRDLSNARDAQMFFFGLAGYLLIAWQIAFPAFAWRPRWRWLLVGGGIVGWIGAIFIYGEPLFGPIYMIACLSFLTAEEWQGVVARIGGLFQGAAKSARTEHTRKAVVKG